MLNKPEIYVHVPQPHTAFLHVAFRAYAMPMRFYRGAHRQERAPHLLRPVNSNVNCCGSDHRPLGGCQEKLQ